MQLDLVIERFSINKLAKADEQRKEIAGACKNRSSSPNVEGKASKMVGPIESEGPGGTKRFRYEFKVRLVRTGGRSEEAGKKALDAGRKFVEKAAEARGWMVKGEAAEVEERRVVEESRPSFVLPKLTPEVFKEHFGEIRERDAHIRLMYASIYTAQLTNGEERNHTLLFGDPASAKSCLIGGFKQWLDSVDGVERIMQVNATTLSKAGLENMLLEKAKDQMLPEVLWINEIEKGDPSDFLCLLAIMDGIGKIQRLNSRIGKQEAKCTLLVFADCNDGDKIKNWNKGALWSRFTKRLPCVRPSRELMTNILHDMINKRKEKGYPSNPAWVKPIIQYSFDTVKNNDPRFIKSLLEGGDGLLDGSYFRDLEAVQKAYQLAEDAKLCV